MMRNLLALLVFFLASMTGACGYRFAGESKVLGQQWSNTTIQMEGPGTDSNPVLAQQIKDRLRTLLTLSGSATDAPKHVLHLHLEPTHRTSILETSSGRSDQFELTIRVRPSLNEGSNRRNFPILTGLARYYEPKAGATTDAVRVKAEKEAVDQLIESLAAMLATYSPSLN
ncbi:MAG: hypothetical protein HQL73_03190 [Magnetococcales bacterium]|nr:hypothetical protein [Magnetococcales bacterium]